jgi:hypothetical protein
VRGLELGGGENKQDNFSFASDWAFLRNSPEQSLRITQSTAGAEAGHDHFLVNFRAVIAAVFGDLEKKRRRRFHIRWGELPDI